EPGGAGPRRDRLRSHGIRGQADGGVPRGARAGGDPHRPGRPPGRAPRRGAGLARAARGGLGDRGRRLRGPRGAGRARRAHDGGGHDGRPLRRVRAAARRGVRRGRDALRRPHRRAALHAQDDRDLRRRGQGLRRADRAQLRVRLDPVRPRHAAAAPPRAGRRGGRAREHDLRARGGQRRLQRRHPRVAQGRARRGARRQERGPDRLGPVRAEPGPRRRAGPRLPARPARRHPRRRARHLARPLRDGADQHARRAALQRTARPRLRPALPLPRGDEDRLRAGRPRQGDRGGGRGRDADRRAELRPDAQGARPRPPRPGRGPGREGAGEGLLQGRDPHADVDRPPLPREGRRAGRPGVRRHRRDARGVGAVPRARRGAPAEARRRSHAGHRPGHRARRPAARRRPHLRRHGGL
ncbi:MAG: hypothetical protein AVDCRST_MAG30-3698, partial [uncultured Solirubrobacteraceae bacterium]